MDIPKIFNITESAHRIHTFTVYYNLRHRRHGRLLDGRYKAKLVEGDDYLLALTRYVHLNPVQVGSIRKRPMEERIEYLRSYPWSSYQGYSGDNGRHRVSAHHRTIGGRDGAFHRLRDVGCRSVGFP